MEAHGKPFGEKLVWSQQVAGKSEVLQAIAQDNKARNSLARRSGFSPEQWVLGRSIRLPGDLLDDGEVARIGAQAAALTPTTRFHRQVQLRTAAREDCIRASNSEALRRAELRRVRPSRGPSSSWQLRFLLRQAWPTQLERDCKSYWPRQQPHRLAESPWHLGGFIAGTSQSGR